eukprot:scaffold3936_cov106-Skeletonema_menzelii.AAC.4
MRTTLSIISESVEADMIGRSQFFPDRPCLWRPCRIVGIPPAPDPPAKYVFPFMGSAHKSQGLAHHGVSI